MEGQSGDCPDIPQRITTPTTPHSRNGGAVGRLPGHLVMYIVKQLCDAAMEGQSGDCPDVGRECSSCAPFQSPQWRGSRETARTVTDEAAAQYGPDAAMEGQSGDCPDPTPFRHLSQGPGAAMEGQSGDCPDVDQIDADRLDEWEPQWRGSRETARTRVGCPHPGQRAAGRNGGAVGRLPGPQAGSIHSQPASKPQWRGSRETARTCHGRWWADASLVAAMEGQSGDCPDFASVRAPTGGVVPQWRGSRETARTAT